jgi:hypothetical protein
MLQGGGSLVASQDTFLWNVREGVNWLHNFRRKALRLDNECRGRQGVTGA